ncbi:MAG TPA: hypothetical protein VF855_01755 [Acidimicrobiales bacterium]
MTVLVQALGWLGSALVVTSLLQQRLLRFRIINLTAGLILVVFNASLGVWPMVALNLTTAAINIWWIHKLLSTADDTRVFDVLELTMTDPYAQKFLSFYGDDIAKFQPDFDPRRATTRKRTLFLVLRDAVPAGAVVLHDHGEGEAHVELDYVVPAERDFSPGKFVYRGSGLFDSPDITRVVATAATREHRSYLKRMGFVADGERWVLRPA